MSAEARDPLAELIDRAFRSTCEAEELIYAAGMKREIKDHVIAAHSALLALKNLLPAPR